MRKRERIAAVVIAMITITIVIVAALLPSILTGGAQPNLPVHEGDYIVWSVNGTRNGVNVSGVSIWTFGNVTSHAEVAGLTGWPKYDVAVRTILDGAVDDFNTAGAYKDAKLWSLGVNPFVVGMGITGYFNPAGFDFDRNQSLSTAYGPKATAVYVEVINETSSDLWSNMWLDANTGMPYQIEVVEPATLNGYANEFSGTLTFQILATNMMH